MRECGPIDRAIGLKIIAARDLRSISQDGLAKLLGCAPTQIWKYENAHNRVSAAALFRIAGLLQMPIAFFYPTQRNLKNDVR